MPTRIRAAIAIGCGIAFAVAYGGVKLLLWPRWEAANTFPDTAGERFHLLFFVAISVVYLVLAMWPETQDDYEEED